MRSSDFHLTDEQLDKINRFAREKSAKHSEAEQFSDVTVSFSFGPPLGRVVTVSFSGSPEIDIDDLP